MSDGGPNMQAEFEARALKVEYFLETASIYAKYGEDEYASIYQKAIPGAIEQRERARRALLSGK